MVFILTATPGKPCLIRTPRACRCSSGQCSLVMSWPLIFVLCTARVATPPSAAERPSSRRRTGSTVSIHDKGSVSVGAVLLATSDSRVHFLSDALSPCQTARRSGAHLWSSAVVAPDQCRPAARLRGPECQYIFSAFQRGCLCRCQPRGFVQEGLGNLVKALVAAHQCQHDRHCYGSCWRHSGHTSVLSIDALSQWHSSRH